MTQKTELQIEYICPNELKDYHRQLRKPSRTQTSKAIRLIQECGFVVPVIISKDKGIIVGQHLVDAAREMKIETIPVIRVEYLDKAQERILRLAHNRIIEEADWDKQALALELSELQIILPDLTITGFDIDEINLTLDIISDIDPADIVPELNDKEAPITKLGDRWILGNHILICGDALNKVHYKALMSNDAADMIFTDPPYNVPVNGHICGNGNIKHDEFAMASGEMSEEEFTKFNSDYMGNLTTFSRDGSLHYICMDWRHIHELLTAGKKHYSELKNICVWNKNNGGMGSFYRSKHELVSVFKHGKEKHLNNIELGSNGRYRTNVWDYGGINSFGNQDYLKMHPTVKPVAMISDAIKDCTKRGQIVLDPFAGSGSTLIACENTNRKARCIELEPKYCDVIIRRWQEIKEQDAIHSKTKQTFNNTLDSEGEKS